MAKPAPGHDDFRPAPGLGGAFRQTAVAALLPARYPSRLPPAERQAESVAGAQRLGVLLTRGSIPVRGRLLLLHGLGGSVSSRYMLRTLAEAHDRGWEVARLNFRGAEEAEGGGPSFHHAGRTDDVLQTVEQIQWSAEARASPLAAVGFSLGGAVLLKYLVEVGSATPLAAAAGVSPPLDLAACLAELERPRNWIYHSYYVRRMRKQIGRTLARQAGKFPPLDRRADTVRKLDDAYTAPDAGYASAAAYYRGASAFPGLGSVAIPSLVLTSRDDPFIPVQLFEGPIATQPPLEIAITARGGHVGYLSANGRSLSFWAAGAVLDWIEWRTG